MERIAFLKNQNAILVGAQGASLAWEQKKDQFPQGYWYCSFDEKYALWEDSGGDPRVPHLSCYANNDDWVFSLGDFGDAWGDDDCLLCFCE